MFVCSQRSCQKCSVLCCDAFVHLCCLCLCLCLAQPWERELALRKRAVLFCATLVLLWFADGIGEWGSLVCCRQHIITPSSVCSLQYALHPPTNQVLNWVSSCVKQLRTDSASWIILNHVGQMFDSGWFNYALLTVVKRSPCTIRLTKLSPSPSQKGPLRYANTLLILKKLIQTAWSRCCLAFVWFNSECNTFQWTVNSVNYCFTVFS